MQGEGPCWEEVTGNLFDRFEVFNRAPQAWPHTNPLSQLKLKLSSS